MSEQIISRKAIRNKGAAAFNAGVPRDGHNMNPGSAAIDDWRAGWDQAQQEKYDRLTRRQSDVIRTAPTPRANPAGEAFSRELIAMVRP